MPDAAGEREWEGFPEGSMFFAHDASFRRYARVDKHGGVTVCRLGPGGEEVVTRLPAYGTPRFWALWMSHDGRYLAYGHSGEDESVPGGVGIWKLDDPTPALRDVPDGMHPHALSFHPDGRRLAIGHTDGTVSVYDLDANRVSLRFEVRG